MPVLVDFPRFVFNTTVRCLQITIVYMTFLIFAMVTLARSTGPDAGIPFLLMSWTVRGMYSYICFLLTIFMNYC